MVEVWLGLKALMALFLWLIALLVGLFSELVGLPRSLSPSLEDLFWMVFPLVSPILKLVFAYNMYSIWLLDQILKILTDCSFVYNSLESGNTHRFDLGICLLDIPHLFFGLQNHLSSLSSWHSKQNWRFMPFSQWPYRGV